jgi:hypothetical protein
MTAQAPDELRLEDRTLTIQGVRGEGLFRPEDVGWETQPMSTACWRGCVATYAVRRGALVLTKLRVSFAWDGLTLPKPFFVVNVHATGSAPQRYEIFRHVAIVGSDPDCDIVLPGDLPPHVLRLLWSRDHAGHLSWQTPTVGWTGGVARGRKLAPGETITLGDHTIRATVAEGIDAIYGAVPPSFHGHPGTWVRSGPYIRTVLYSRMSIPMPFTGGLLACDGFIRELYVHMGFHPAWKFEHVEELLFDEGRLTRREDVSEELARVRSRLVERPLKPGPTANIAEISAWIDRVFTLEY